MTVQTAVLIETLTALGADVVPVGALLLAADRLGAANETRR